MSKQAMKLALDALTGSGYYDTTQQRQAIAALREALAEHPAPPECQTEAEKTAFAFGWFKALESVRNQPPPSPLQRAVDLHEKSGMPWMQAEKLALEEVGIGDAEIDEVIGNSSDGSTAITGLLSEEELRAFVRSILLYQHAPPAIEAAHGIKDHP